MGIVVEDISKQFGTFRALDHVGLVVPDGKLVALLGPSGSGKSTLLRAIAGLESPDQGKIWINGQEMTNLNVQERQIGFVFQHYALFKHLTVRQNIAFGLEIRKVKGTEVRRRVNELLDLIQLEGLGDRYPAQLSGGQRQRVALARALAVQPQVLLLDEPFGALDAQVRKDLRRWLRDLHHQVNLTSVFVTHDQEEAMEVADEIVIMNQGRIEQVGTPQAVYDKPATPFVMKFVGEVNILPSFLDRRQHQEGSSVFVRPHAVKIQNELTPTSLAATISHVVYRGWGVHVELMLPDRISLTAQLDRQEWEKLGVETGDTVQVELNDAIAFTDAYELEYYHPSHILQ